MLRIKKILAFAAMIIIVAPIFIFCTLLIKQKLVQHHMTEKLENASLQTIIVNDGQFIWVKENKEIEINKRLFDVKYYTTKNGKTVFTGLFDEEESKIKKAMADFIKHDENNKIPNEQLLKYLFNPSINFKEDFAIQHFIGYVKTKYLFFNNKAVSITLPAFTPPPNI